jgi:hypothetical protein
MLPYDSLRQRLVQPFLLLGFVVSASLSLTTFALLAQIEERAVERTLNVELESFRHRRAINPLASPAESSLLRGVFLPAEQLTRYPELSSDAAILEMRTLDDGEFSVLFARVDGRPFALLYDRSYIKSNMASLALLLLLATGGMTLLSFAVGYRLSRRVVQPIVRLLDEVSFKAGQSGMPAEGIGFSAQDYPPDEIGRLVRELDRFSHRLYEFVRRESSFAADVSHELRTPVAVISGAAEVLAEVPGLDDAVRQRISAIHRNAVRMSQVLEAMLILAKEERSDADPSCNLADVVDDVVADCLPALQGRPVSAISFATPAPTRARERSASCSTGIGWRSPIRVSASPGIVFPNCCNDMPRAKIAPAMAWVYRSWPGSASACAGRSPSRVALDTGQNSFSVFPLGKMAAIQVCDVTENNAALPSSGRFS